jgi:hypothetical protein
MTSMDRNDDIKDNGVDETDSLEEIVETRRDIVSTNEAAAKICAIATSSTADNNQNISIEPTSHLRKSSKEVNRKRAFKSGDTKALKDDENDSSLSSVSSDECGHADQKLGDHDYPQMINSDSQMDNNPNLASSDSALLSKREYNRNNAARARKRAKSQLQTLKQHVQALNMSITLLKERNLSLHQTVHTLNEQNALLAQTQKTIEDNNAAAVTNVASNPYATNTATTTSISSDPTLQMTLLQLLLATATTPSPALTMQPPAPAVSLQQQTLYYCLLAAMLPKYQQPQNINAIQPIQLHSPPPVSASDQLTAVLLSQLQSGTAGLLQPDRNDASTKSSYHTSRDAQLPPR